MTEKKFQITRSKYFLKNIGIFTISNFTSKILVFLLVPLYTSVLSTEEFGVYDLIISTVALLHPFLTLNIADAVMRFSMDKTRDISDVISVGIKYTAFSFIPIIPFLMIVKFTSLLSDIEGLEILILLYFVFYVSNNFLIQAAKGLECVSDMGIAGVISTVTLIGGNVLLLLRFQMGLKGFFISAVLAQTAPTLYLAIRLRMWKYFSSIRLKRVELRTEMLVYCIPLIVTAVGWWVNNAVDKYVVAFMLGVAANGILSVAYKIPSILNAVQSIFIQAWQISAIKEYEGKKSQEFYGDAFIILNSLMVGACSILILFSVPIARILYVNDFFVAWQYVPFLLVAGVINSASGFMGPILAAAKDSKSMALSAFYGSISNVILNITLIYIIGIQGAAIATALSSFVIFEVRRRAVKEQMPIKEYPFVILTWIVIVAQSIVSILSLAISYQVITIMANAFILLYLLRRIRDEYKNKHSESNSGGWNIAVRSGYFVPA